MPKYSYTYKALNYALGKALHTYDMICDSDRIAVGVSGGKDSWALLWLLAERQRRAPVNYTLVPIHIDPGFDGGGTEALDNHVQQMGLSLCIEHTDFGVKAHRPENRENPCFLCSHWRRKRLFEIADDHGCGKLALGHNKDDLIETLFINMLYAGEISTMIPYQPFFGGKLTVIRPLAYTDEDTLGRFAQEMSWPVVDNPCPSAGTSKRAEIKAMLEKLYAGNPKIKGNIFRAMRHVNTDYLLKPTD